MLKIDIPVRLLRGTVRRCSQFYKGRPKGPDVAPQTENNDLIPADQTGIRNNRRQYAIPICSALLIWYGVRAAL